MTSTPPKPPAKRKGNPDWAPGGKSPNPRGRPRIGVSLAAAVRQAWPPDRLVELATELAVSPDPAIRMRALEWLADRGHGKVPTTIDATLSQGPALDAERMLAKLSTETLRELTEASESLALEAGTELSLDE